jgi:hypothetical protein
MTNKELISVAFKLFAIYVATIAITQFTGLSYVFTGFFNGIKGPALFSFIPILAVIVLFSLALILWKLSNNVILSMSKETQDNDDLKVDQRFILNIVGFYLLFQGLLELISGSMQMIYLHNNSDFYSDMKIRTILYTIGSVIKVIVALTLILRSKGWVKLLWKIKQLG